METHPNIDPKEDETGVIIQSDQSKTKSSNAYDNLERGLTLDELSQSGTQKLILKDLSTGEERIRNLEPYREMYHNIKSERDVLKEKLIKVNTIENLQTVGMSLGGIIIGLAKNWLLTDKVLAVITLIIGIILLFGSIFSKKYFKK